MRYRLGHQPSGISRCPAMIAQDSDTSTLVQHKHRLHTAFQSTAQRSRPSQSSTTKTPSQYSLSREFVCPNLLQPHHSKRSRTQSICTSLCHTYTTLQTLTYCNEDVLGWVFISDICSLLRETLWPVVSDISVLLHPSIYSAGNLTFYITMLLSIHDTTHILPIKLTIRTSNSTR
ncbi:hypothetical protein FOQG_02776 [Fusarium oxysporum f. sp. raphani 54005]|uniref:Uncharacterized protein n=2 Tax=Fusarium oxysporum TaxID=5507 RepID=X0D257_FUSOX|nr:hypothetical protein FOVG_07818 [Fusarium oxysporum f. sp. pisi HDV247]EXA42659.1 hypothetical protein FOVG_07818 [Fusarium oxysporum f. sp. pisi HDV247]EXK97653.1 hypothetical protein FOQG_02776 [Fusarium oxysporum f. sp. raphani 54005]